MSASTGERAPTAMVVRRALPLAVIVGLILLAAVLAGPGAEGPPLDPRSTGPAGTKALVDSLRELGVPVMVEPDAIGQDVARALLLTDDLDDGERDTLTAWVERGGVLVVTDPRSPLVPEVVGSAGIAGIGVAPLEPDCPLTALRDAREVLPDAGAVVYAVPDGAVGCFHRDDGSWLVAEPRGAGTVVALGGPDVLVNARLGTAAHPELLAALLVPESGGVAVLRTRLPGEGDAGLAELIGDNVRLFGVQLLLALLLVIAWRARRLGRPVDEPQPVAIPGSELVTAVGNLFHEAGARARTAALLQSDLQRTLERRLGLPGGSAPQTVAAAAAARTGVDAEELAGILSARVPDDEHALVVLAHDIERLRADALGVPAAAPRRNL